MEYDLLFEEIEKAFDSLEFSKAHRHKDIKSNVIIKIKDEVDYLLFMVFSKDILFEQLKDVKVLPVFKTGDIKKMGNFR